VPWLHARHADAPADETKLPAVQFWHLVVPRSLAYVPAGQRAHSTVPDDPVYVPLGHCVQAEDPGADALVPGSHDVHAVREADEYDPAAHWERDRELDEVEMLPAGHGRQPLFPIKVEQALVA
jgi:hypothetical protein